MKLIQLVLMTVVLAGSGIYFVRLRSRLVDRLFVLAFATVALAMVSAPEIADRLAAVLEVGRGVDVVTYFLLLFLCFFWMLLYSRLRDQHAQLVELTRLTAMAVAQLPERETARDPEISPQSSPQISSVTRPLPGVPWGKAG